MNDAVVLVAIGAVGATWAAITDLRYGRVTNGTVATIAILGLVVRGAFGGVSSVTWGAMGACVGAVAIAPPYRMRRIGAGDAKLVIALSLLLGPVGACFMTAVAAALAGGTALLLQRWAVPGESDRVSIPVAPQIAVGAALGAVLATFA
jgi:prepilin peptidase CpaA